MNRKSWVDAMPSSAPDQRPPVRPYPAKYAGEWTTKSGARVLIRPIRPEDEPLLAKFHEGLSNTSVYLRYFHMMSLDARVAHARLMRQCFIDYDREMALVADFENPNTREHEIWAVGRLTKNPDGREAEVAVLVTDLHQKEGLGTELVRRLIEIARDEKLQRILAHILPDNSGMISLGKHFNFRAEPSSDPAALTVVLDL
ncbi:MAG TPA: GNAT family N-acetyltransferase [Candidatus Aquilonibacter sp.]|nr:GNAT family N-acetyltransferase [Candidatus Aquilonibacter sp.]